MRTPCSTSLAIATDVCCGLASCDVVRVPWPDPLVNYRRPLIADTLPDGDYNVTGVRTGTILSSYWEGKK